MKKLPPNCMQCKGKVPKNKFGSYYKTCSPECASKIRSQAASLRVKQGIVRSSFGRSY